MTEQPDNTVFQIDMSSPEISLSGLRSTAALLPLEHLQGWLSDFIKQQRFEDAAVIRDEIEHRKNGEGPKFEMKELTIKEKV